MADLKKNLLLKSLLNTSLLISTLLTAFDLFLGFYYSFPYNVPTFKTLFVSITGFFLYLILSFIIVSICYTCIKKISSDSVSSELIGLESFIISITFIFIAAFSFLQSSASPVGVYGLKLLIFFIFLFCSGLSVQYIYHSDKNWIKKISDTYPIITAFYFVSTISLFLIYTIGELHDYNFSKKTILVVAGCWSLFFLIFILLSFNGGKFKISHPAKLKLIAVTLLFVFIPSLLLFSLSKKVVGVKSDNKGFNFILVVFDTLRADGVGAYGSSLKTTAIDEIAKKGILFDNAYSLAPWTLPSMTSFFSSRYPSELELLSEKKEKWKFYKIPESVNTFAEALQKKNYITKALIGNWVLNSKLGILQGFNSYKVLNHHQKTRNMFSQTLPLLESIFVYFFPKPEYMYFPDTCATLTNDAINFIRQNHNNNFFLWLHYIDPHDPYNPPEKYRKTKIKDAPWPIFAPDDAKSFNCPSSKDIRSGDVLLTDSDKKYIKELYDGDIEYVSDLFEKVIGQLKDKKILDNTVICITADHGEEFWDHGNFNHGISLYNELVKVPLIMYIPHFKGKRNIKEAVSLIDIMPTFFDIAGLQVPSHYEGKSLLSYLNNENDFVDKPIFFEGAALFNREKAIISGKYKLIIDLDNGKKELYDLSSDPHETNNIAYKNPDQVEIMSKELQKWMMSKKNIVQDKNNYEKETKTEQMKRMRALGYIQ